MAKLDTGGTRYVQPDHLGTPSLMTNSSKATVWQIEAKPFGDGASITGTASLNLRFPGQYFDQETGLHQNWHRDYLTGVGRYAEPEILTLGTIALPLYPKIAGFSPGSLKTGNGYVVLAEITRLHSLLDLLLNDPLRQHNYAGVLDNPLKFADPNGRMALAVGGVLFVGSYVFLGVTIHCIYTCTQCLQCPKSPDPAEHNAFLQKSLPCIKDRCHPYMVLTSYLIDPLVSGLHTSIEKCYEGH